MSLLLEARGVTVLHRRALSLSPPVLAVAEVSLRVAEGERVALLGASGCGKSSLLRALCGLDTRSAGEVSLLGVDPARAGRPPAGVQLLLQDAGASLHPELTVAEALAESARVHRPGQPEAAAAALARNGLTHRHNALPASLSGGEKRRVTLAMLSLAAPRLLLADEPTAGLDANRKAEVLAQLVSQVGTTGGMLLVTHDLYVARNVCTRLLVMDAGRLVDEIAPHGLARATHPVTRRLVEATGLGAQP